MNNSPRHKTVMIKEASKYVNLENGDTFLDATLGGGGHSKAILDKYDAINVIGIDKDIQAINIAQKNLKHKAEAYHLLVGFLGSEQNTGALLSQKQALLLVDSLRVEINKEVANNAGRLKEQMESLATNLSSLNGVYGGMLSAMNKR